MGRTGPQPGGYYTIACKACHEDRYAHSYKASTCLSCLEKGFKYCPSCGEVKATELFSLSNKMRDGYTSYCKKCRSERSVAVNKKHATAQDEQYEKRKKASRDYCAEHYATDAEWRQLRVEQSKQYERPTRDMLSTTELDNVRKVSAAASRRLYKDNPSRKDYIIAKNHARRASETGGFTADQFAQCKEFFNNSCAYCGDTGNLTIEHIIPISKGGTNNINNIIAACSTCNASKNATSIFDWYPKQSFYEPERLIKINQWFKTKSKGVVPNGFAKY